MSAASSFLTALREHIVRQMPPPEPELPRVSFKEALIAHLAKNRQLTFQEALLAHLAKNRPPTFEEALIAHIQRQNNRP